MLYVCAYVLLFACAVAGVDSSLHDMHATLSSSKLLARTYARAVTVDSVMQFEIEAAH